MLEFRPYSISDREPCVDVFRSNTPKFFHPNEVDEYTKYLDQYVSDNYWCALKDGAVIGCGGIWIRPDRIARVVWGIIHRDHHKKGYGRALLEFRLRELAKVSSVETIQLDTSQYNPGFFQRFGFEEFKVKKDGYSPGLHSHEMELKVTPSVRKRLLSVQGPTSSGNPAVDFVNLLVPGSFKMARALLTPECEYHSGSQILHGDAIIKAFEDSHHQAEMKLDQIEYLPGHAESSVGNTTLVRVFDRIRIDRVTHTYSDRLEITVVNEESDYRISKIVHRPIDDERRALGSFLDQNKKASEGL